MDVRTSKRRFFLSHRHSDLILSHRHGRNKRLHPRDRPAQNQGVDIVRALVCVDRLQVHSVADDMILVHDAVAAQHVPCGARDVERLEARIALDHRDLAAQ